MITTAKHIHQFTLKISLRVLEATLFFLNYSDHPATKTRAGNKHAIGYLSTPGPKIAEISEKSTGAFPHKNKGAGYFGTITVGVWRGKYPMALWRAFVPLWKSQNYHTKKHPLWFCCFFLRKKDMLFEIHEDINNPCCLSERGPRVDI